MKSILDSLDLKADVDPDVFKKEMSSLEQELGQLQREAREKNIPIAIVLDGWDAAGKGTCINRLSLAFDARGTDVHSLDHSMPEAERHPWLWRHWIEAPARGRIAIYDRGWCGQATDLRGRKDWSKDAFANAVLDINRFEKELTDDGVLLLKFFLHISRKEQKKRFEKLEKNPDTEWRLTGADWDEHRNYNRYRKIFASIIKCTDRPDAPWTLVPAEDRRTASLTIFKTVAGALRRRLREKSRTVPIRPAVPKATYRGGAVPNILARADLSLRLDLDAYEREVKKCQTRLYELENRIYRERVPVVIAYEGWDAAGKGGNIRRLVQGLDPRGYDVVPIGAPTPLEMSFHYLRRFWVREPKTGHIAIFDRTWYGRVLVERVEGFCSEAEWRRAYDEINDMERQWTDAGVVLVKFWLQIDRATQLRRFKERESTSYKEWKITAEDWRNRRKWPAYEAAVNEMLARTGTTHAPWTVVESNDKLHARIKSLKTVIEAIENRL